MENKIENKNNKGLSCKDLLNILKNERGFSINGKQIKADPLYPSAYLRAQSDEIKFPKCQQKPDGQIELGFQHTRHTVEDGAADAYGTYAPYWGSTIVSNFSATFKNPKLKPSPSGHQNIVDPAASDKQEVISHKFGSV